MLTVNSTINLAGQAVPNIIPAVQGDTGRVIVFTLADFTIPAGSTATYYVQKPSGEAVYNSATIDSNKVTVELTAQSLAETGDNYGQVRILNDEDVVTSFDFILLVKPFRGIDAIESTTEMNIFDEAVQNAMAQFDSMLPDIIAPEFDSSTEYAAWDYVIYGGKLYQFTSAHAAGAWTGADAEECTVAEDISQLKEDFQNIKGVPNTVRQAILTLLTKATYTETGLTDEKAIVEEWASVTAVGIVLSEQSISFNGEGTHQLRAILTPPDSTDEPLWSTSNANVAVVSQSGLVSTVGNGSCTISASIGSLVATCNVTVSGVVCSVVNTLTNCTNSNAATTIEAGSAYSATLTPTTDFTLSEVTVTMNGEDVTSTVYADGEISIPSVTGNIVIVAKAYIIAAWDMSLGRVPSTDDGITYTPAASAFTVAYDATNGLVLTGTGSTNVKYEPTGHTTINKGSFEMTYTIVSAAVNGQLNPRMSDGTSGANIAITRTANLGYHIRETLASSDDYDVIMNSYSLNTEYTMKVEYEKGVGVVVYIDGEKVYESATESTYYATNTRLFAMSTIKCYIKSMKWIIEEVA